MAEWDIGKRWGKWDKGREAENLLGSWIARVGSLANAKQDLIILYQL